MVRIHLKKSSEIENHKHQYIVDFLKVILHPVLPCYTLWSIDIAPVWLLPGGSLVIAAEQCGKPLPPTMSAVSPMPTRPEVIALKT